MNFVFNNNYLNVSYFFLIEFVKKKSPIYINHSLNQYLLDLEKQIEEYINWKKYKSYINCYENLHKNDINQYYYLIYIEIYNQFKYLTDNITNILHISDNPVISFNAYSKEEENHHLIYNKNIALLTNKYDLIICDIFDNQFNIENEMKYSNLIFIQILISLMSQNKNGHLVIKLYDVFQYSTVEMIYMLTCFYSSVTIYKPNTLDVISSEKYLICKGFNYEHVDLEHIYNLINTSNEYIDRIFSFDIGYIFINKITEMNSVLGQSQIETIKSIINLNLSENISKLESIKSYNIKKCNEWCQKYVL